MALPPQPPIGVSKAPGNQRQINRVLLLHALPVLDCLLPLLVGRIHVAQQHCCAHAFSMRDQSLIQ